MKIVRILFVLFFIALSFVTSSCSYDKREMPNPNSTPDTTIIINCDTTQSVTYTNFVKSVMETNCTFTGCHGTDAPPGFDYTTYDLLKVKVDSGRFQLRVLNKKDMPLPNSQGPDTLDNCTLLKLQKWVNNGAPE